MPYRRAQSGDDVAAQIQNVNSRKVYIATLSDGVGLNLHTTNSPVDGYPVATAGQLGALIMLQTEAGGADDFTYALGPDETTVDNDVATGVLVKAGNQEYVYLLDSDLWVEVGGAAANLYLVYR